MQIADNSSTKRKRKNPRIPESCRETLRLRVDVIAVGYSSSPNMFVPSYPRHFSIFIIGSPVAIRVDCFRFEALEARIEGIAKVMLRAIRPN